MNTNNPPKDPNQSSKNYTNEPIDTGRVSGDKIKSSDAYTQKEWEEQKAHREKFSDKIRDFKDAKKFENIYHFAASNKEQTIAYILLAIGLILLLLFNSLLGGLIIGMVAGYFFAPEVIHYLRNFGQIIEGEDHVRYVILTTLLLAFFITSPGIFIGAIIVAVFKKIMQGQNTSL